MTGRQSQATKAKGAENDRAPAAPPCAMVIFGAAGDLTKRLVVPALYNLSNAKRLSKGFQLVGVDLAAKSTEEWRQGLSDMMNQFVAQGGGEFQADHIDQTAWRWLTDRMSYLQGDLNDPGTFRRLGEHLAELDKSAGTSGNYLFYLAVADRFFATAVAGIGAAGLAAEKDGQWRRVVIEKPFGHDLPSAKALNAEILKTLQERQIYRIDHFLGKETVQNIMVLRFANGIFEPLWNRDHIDHIQITVAETVGVEHRANFYEATGALRDMVPNHVFQLLALTAMEPPNSFAADAVRAEKTKVLEAIRPLDAEGVRRDVVRGQYRAGVVAGRPVKSYREEEGVAPGSMTETYVALRLDIDNWRWAGVPFYLRTGKALARRTTEIAIHFKRPPFVLFRDTAVDGLTPNVLVLQIQPDEGISLQFEAKIPGPEIALGGVEMEFRYRDYFKIAPSTGYETLLYDCMIGDATLFQRADSVEAGWAVVQPILDLWREDKSVPLEFYDAGSAGPQAAELLLRRSGRQWRPLGG